MKKEIISYAELTKARREHQDNQTWPYGFKLWMNALWQAGQSMGIWNFTVISYRDKLCYKSWLVYFMDGLSPKNAILQDIKEGGE